MPSNDEDRLASLCYASHTNMEVSKTLQILNSSWVVSKGKDNAARLFAQWLQSAIALFNKSKLDNPYIAP